MTRRLTRRLLGGAAALTGLALAALAYVYLASQAILDKRYPVPVATFHAPRTAEAVARGDRITLIAGCKGCHGDGLEGELFGHAPPDTAIYARNLRRLALVYSDGDFEHAIRHAVKPDGRGVIVMPSDAYTELDDSEIGAIIAYIRSLPVAAPDTPPPSIGLKTRLATLRGEGDIKPDILYFPEDQPALDLGPRFAKGKHIAATVCAECHGTDLKGYPGAAPDLVLVASYERADFFKLMRTGKGAGDREVGFMSRTARYRFKHFRDDEIDALYDYLATRGRTLTAN